MFGELEAGDPERSLVVAVRSADLVVELNDTFKLHLDTYGRWLSYRSGQGLWRRSLDGAVGRARRSGRTLIARQDPKPLHDEVSAFAARVLEIARAAPSRIHWVNGRVDSGGLAEVLERAMTWNGERYQREAHRYTEVYPEAVRILPPDRARDLVVMPSVGCPHGRCAFCAFYRQTPYRVLSTTEFAAQLRSLASWLGRAVELRDGLFIGGANALALADRRLVEILHMAQGFFGAPRRGVAAFWDPDHSPTRGVADYATLVASGLSHAYAGLETGNPELRGSLGKATDVARFESAVKTASAGGLQLGVIVLAGVEENGEAHLDDTTRSIERMQLRGTDVVYVSPLTQAPRRKATEEAELLSKRLRAVTPARVAPYCLDDFRYYA